MSISRPRHRWYDDIKSTSEDITTMVEERNEADMKIGWLADDLTFFLLISNRGLGLSYWNTTPFRLVNIECSFGYQYLVIIIALLLQQQLPSIAFS